MRENLSREPAAAIVLQRYLVQEAGGRSDRTRAKRGKQTCTNRERRSKEIENDNANGREEKSTNTSGENRALQKCMCKSKANESHVTCM